jgi:hypothetical protein
LPVTTCPECGFENPDDRDFCAECQSYLRWDQTEEIRPSAPEDLSASLDKEEWPEPSPVSAVPAQATVDPIVVTMRFADSDGAEEPYVPVEPGSGATVLVSVRNQMPIVGRFDLDVRGIPRDWWTATPPTLHLLPFTRSEAGSEQEAQLLLHPPRTPEARAGDWPFEAVAAAQGSNTAASATGTLHLGVFRDLDVALRPTRVEAQDRARFAVAAHNRGNADAEVLFAGEDQDGEASFSFQPPRLFLAPGEELEAQMDVVLPRPEGADRRSRTLTVRASDGSTTLARLAEFVQLPAEPFVTPRRLTIFRIVLTLIAALLLVISAFIDWQNKFPGICLHGRGDNCMSYAQVANGTQFASSIMAWGGGTRGLRDLVFFVSSAGFLMILFAMLALLGLPKGRATRVAGFLTIVCVGVFLLVSDVGQGSGAALALTGGVLALFAGCLTFVKPEA